MSSWVGKAEAERLLRAAKIAAEDPYVRMFETIVPGGKESAEAFAEQLRHDYEVADRSDTRSAKKTK